MIGSGEVYGRSLLPGCIALTLSQTTNFRLFKKRKEFADDNFKLCKNGGNLSKRVENTVGKGEIARYEQFLLFHSVFKNLVLQTHKNPGLFGKGLIPVFGRILLSSVVKVSDGFKSPYVFQLCVRVHKNGS